uniref:glutathione transferase n=1 Tax=Equus caballus TaxID=9796 RepID=A0A3Q2H1N1_HORSE
MAAKPKLHYLNGRGRMEPIRWLLAAAGVEFEEEFLATSKDLEKLRNDGSLMFQQVPMVEIDGMKLVQCRAILNYIAAKYNLYGKDIKERALIDMYIEGVADLNEMYIHLILTPPSEKAAKITEIKDKTTNRYLPAFEKGRWRRSGAPHPPSEAAEEGERAGESWEEQGAQPACACVPDPIPIRQVLKSHGQDYLVGNRLSRADIHLVELLYTVEELDPSLLANFPLLKALKARISNLPTVKKFLQPGSPRKPPVDEKNLAKVKEIFQLK